MKRKLSEWADCEFSPESKPSRATLLRWAEKGKIPGAVYEHDHWWVSDELASKQKELSHAIAKLPPEHQSVFGN